MHKRCGVSALINSLGMYDYNNMNFIKWYLADGGVLFDIGANIGSYSLVGSENMDGLVYAFEPHPVTFKYLQKNVKLNKRSNVKAINMAVGSEIGVILLTDVSGSATNHRVLSGGEGSIKVECCRIDSFCEENQVLPNILKIDVEGYEMDVLIGAGCVLENVDIIMVEINKLGHKINAKNEALIIEYLAKREFIGPFLVDFDGQVLRRASSWHREDSVFISTKYIKKIKWEIEDALISPLGVLKGSRGDLRTRIKSALRELGKKSPPQH